MTSPSLENKPRLTLEVAELWPAQGQWTEDDYFKLPETSRIVELSEGSVSIMPPPSFTHQRVLDNLYAALRGFVKRHGLGITAFAPVAVRLWPGKIREPDIVFYTEEHRNRIGELVSEPPDLAAEVLSPGTRRTDRHEKFFEYAQVGIAEYWLVDPEQETIEVFVLESGVYTLLVKANVDGVAHSRLIDGFSISATDIFA